MDKEQIWIDCTGDVVKGDTISFDEAIWVGNFRNPKCVGKRRIVAEVLKDSYGHRKQQHTFTLKVIECIVSKECYFIDKDTRIMRKGRNIYKNGTRRLEWDDEEARKLHQIEKHQRGDEARRIRAKRREIENLICSYF